jgi:hypothetical protein
MIQEYFSRISEFKENIEVIGDTIDEDKLIMMTLNGLTRPWDAFIQTICARTEKLKFDSLWEECIQEESRVANREPLLSRDEDQALDTHTKGGRNKSTSRNKLIKSLTPKSNSYIKHLNLRYSTRKDKEKKETSHLTNDTIVTRWDILQDIVQLDKKNTRGKTRGIMPMQLKMKSHPQR